VEQRFHKTYIRVKDNILIAGLVKQPLIDIMAYPNHPCHPSSACRQVRAVLLMPALRPAAGKGRLAAFYKRLASNGKEPMTATTAVVRKIVVTLNARISDAAIPQS
jgi:hypothetical protein